ncbi:MAG: hypothetical protein R3315_00190 [Woeseiaceae bacterium]|nr:hypothetical protein [Woeseiaceae bacterium]
MSEPLRFREQLRGNLVAIISLAVALASLGYNTWRNEKTELNRNLRNGGLELLMQSAELRELTYLIHYDTDVVGEGAARRGWVTVLAIRDLSRILPPPVPASAEALHSAWGAHWESLAGKRASKDAVDAAVEALVDDTVTMLENLD